jgi:hypothetical protein
MPIPPIRGIGHLKYLRGSTHAEGPRDHNARSDWEVSAMARRDMHPLLMWWEEERRKVENKALERLDAQITGLESPQHKRFLRAEAEEEVQAKPDECDEADQAHQYLRLCRIVRISAIPTV